MDRPFRLSVGGNDGGVHPIDHTVRRVSLEVHNHLKLDLAQTYEVLTQHNRPIRVPSVQRPQQPRPPRHDRTRARVAAIEDLPAILEVIQAAFPRWPSFELAAPAIDHLRWKLGPAGEEAIADHIVIELDGRVVAVRLAWNAACHIGGTPSH
jgi:hypothetical protein